MRELGDLGAGEGKEGKVELPKAGGEGKRGDRG